MSVNNKNERVGTVTDGEKNEIMYLFERMNGLKELLPILETGEKAGDNDKGIYDRAVSDLGATAKKHQDWWDRMGDKYNWKGRGKAGATWRINFKDNTIYLQDAAA